MAVTEYGAAFRYSDARWTAYRRLGNGFTSVSCPSASICVAMDGSSYTYSE